MTVWYFMSDKGIHEVRGGKATLLSSVQPLESKLSDFTLLYDHKTNTWKKIYYESIHTH